MVMRLGMAWGLTMMSGTSPSAVSGISAASSTMPMTPLTVPSSWSLSPTIGARRARAHLGEERAVPILRLHDRVDDRVVAVLDDHAAIALDGAPRALADLGGHDGLADDHVARLDGGANGQEAVGANRVVALHAHADAILHGGGVFNFSVSAPLVRSFVLVHLVLDRTKEPPLERRAVDDERVLMVEA